MNIHQFLLALRGRFWVFASLVAGTIVAAVAVTLALPKTYDATVSMLVGNRDEQSLAGTMPSGRDQVGYMQTQIDILTSPRVATEVAKDLKLGEDPKAQAAFKASGMDGDINEWIGKGLLTRVKVDSSQSAVVQLTYSASDPQFAAKVANGFAHAFMATALNLRVEPTRQAASWFDDQLKSLRKELEQAQMRLANFQKEKGIIATDERIDVENARLAELSTQLVQAQNTTYDAASRSGVAKSSSPDTVPEVLGNPLVQALKTQVLTAESKLQELATRLGPNHPEYRQQASEVHALRARLNAEVQKVIAGVQNVTAQNRARERALEESLAAQRAKVVEMRDARNQASLLQRDVETAQKAYEAALSRYLVNKVESGARQANVSILSPAAEPTRPSNPKVFLNIVLGVLIGIALGLAAVFLLELLDRRVRSSADLESGLDAPLLGTLNAWHPSRLLGGNAGARALPGPA